MLAFFWDTQLLISLWFCQCRKKNGVIPLMLVSGVISRCDLWARAALTAVCSFTTALPLPQLDSGFPGPPGSCWHSSHGCQRIISRSSVKTDSFTAGVWKSKQANEVFFFSVNLREYLNYVSFTHTLVKQHAGRKCCKGRG